MSIFQLKFVILLFVSPLALALQDVIPSFTPNGVKKITNGTNFTSILLINKSIYVGAKDKLIRLDASNIENTDSQIFLNLPANSEQREQCMITYYDERLCSNYIKVILNRQLEHDLYICGTYAFMPRLFQFSYDLQLIKEDDGYGYCSLNPLDSSTAVWIENGNPLGIGSLYSASLLDASTKTQPVEPVIYRPELRRGDKSFQYLRTPKFDSDWLNQPKFLASFDVDDYVLFFLKEKSIEQIAEGQDINYGRVIRVCKNDMGSINLGNQWSSMRKSRLTCIYNNTYLDNLESVVRVNEDLFIALFTSRLPGKEAVSFLCEFQKDNLLSSLNAPAKNFKELVPGTQYWSKLSVDKVPKNYPNQCNYNSNQLKDEVLNFAKTHCLIGDYIDGKLIQFVSASVTAFAVDTVFSANIKDSNTNSEPEKISIYYLGTADGRIIRMSSLNPNTIISIWKMNFQEPINEIKLEPSSFLVFTTENSIQQISLNQCDHYKICSTCMVDPYCGWNIRSHKCENVESNTNLIALNSNLCSRFQRLETSKFVHLDNAASAKLDCGVSDEYLLDQVQWKREEKPIDYNNNIFLSESKDLVILNGNSSQNGIYACYIKTDIIASYNLNFKPINSIQAESVATTNQKCITAESYIRQYNNWCDEYSRYQRALNDWEELKDKSCSSNSNAKSGRN